MLEYESYRIKKVTTFLGKGTLWDTEKRIFRLIYEKSNRCPRVYQRSPEKAKNSRNDPFLNWIHGLGQDDIKF